MIKRILLFYLYLCWCCGISVAQKQDVSSLKEQEEVLKKWSSQLIYGKNAQLRIAANDTLLHQLKLVLLNPASWDYPFDSLRTLAILKPEDERFRLFNWELKRSETNYTYYTLLQSRDKKSGAIKLVEFIDKSDDIKKPEQDVLDPLKWWGAHYYKIIERHYKKNTYYTLLGIDWNDGVSRKKLVDVFTLDKKGNIKMGEAIFKMPKRTQKRVFFEYSAEVSMSLTERDGRIVFDHLSPKSPELQGQYQYYGPDMSYDAFEFIKGKWIYFEGIDVRNEKTKQDDQYHNPNKK